MNFSNLCESDLCKHLYFQALRNEQERTLADMRDRHEQDTLKVNEKLERELAAEEAQAMEHLEADKERRLRELKDRHAAELAARSKDMSPEEVQQVRQESLFQSAQNSQERSNRHSAIHCHLMQMIETV